MLQIYTEKQLTKYVKLSTDSKISWELHTEIVKNIYVAVNESIITNKIYTLPVFGLHQ